MNARQSGRKNMSENNIFMVYLFYFVFLFLFLFFLIYYYQLLCVLIKNQSMRYNTICWLCVSIFFSFYILFIFFFNIYYEF